MRTTKPTPKPGRPRGDRHERVVLRVSAAERAEIAAACERAGCTLGDALVAGARALEAEGGQQS